MDNLHRDLAPISAAAWADLEDEARRTFTRHIAARRIVDVPEPGGTELAGVGSGHLADVAAPAEGVTARVRRFQPLVELRVPFTVDRQQVDDVARGARDADWQPVKDAARKIAFAEDRAVFEGYAAADITGLRQSSSNAALALSAEVRAYPDVVSKALTALRLAGVGGPYALALSAEAYTAVSETSDYGYPVIEHIARVLDGDIVWAPAIDGAFLLSKRGGDFELRIGQDLSIGYLSHDETTIRLYFQETLTFLAYTGEAVVPVRAETSTAGRPREARL
ncbi:family 1 encapsulin nanocompartment shell protein [Streptomyces sp. NPDC004629]|uniref:family 1 encapsulin nanocompartment shell protein n=1 Tax=Streptomyces sp. NPDC004629 TaxID=3364705 RepID=UPI0036998858